ncbi:hypothetical protein N7540_005477 [Penicillium herquei]|nr:hypothetical protein N7540_005477 [Penicillium herquei]
MESHSSRHHVRPRLESRNRRSTPLGHPSLLRVNSRGQFTRVTREDFPDGENERPRRKLNPGNLPKHVTDILKTWFKEHEDHPYPSEEVKQMLTTQTGLSIAQYLPTRLQPDRKLVYEFSAENYASSAEQYSKRWTEKPRERQGAIYFTFSWNIVSATLTDSGEWVLPAPKIFVFSGFK